MYTSKRLAVAGVEAAGRRGRMAGQWAALAAAAVPAPKSPAPTTSIQEGRSVSPSVRIAIQHLITMLQEGEIVGAREVSPEMSSTSPSDFKDFLDSLRWWQDFSRLLIIFQLLVGGEDSQEWGGCLLQFRIL